MIPLRRSLAGRLFRFTVIVVLILEALVFLPEIGHERRSWLSDRVNAARIAAVTAASVPAGSQIASLRDRALQQMGIETVRSTQDGKAVDLWTGAAPAVIKQVEFDDESGWLSSARAIATLLRSTDDIIEISQPTDIMSRVSVGVRQRQLAHDLRDYAFRSLAYSVVESLLAGIFVYVAIYRLFVGPMRQLILNIDSFSADPERVPVQDTIVSEKTDEFGHASRQLAAMQRELRGALWRNARLAAIGTSVAKLSHDLRGTLSPAMLAAERLQMNKDPSVSRTGEILVKAVERAVEMVRGPLEFAREGTVAFTRKACALDELLNHAIDLIRVENADFKLVPRGDLTLSVEGDPGSLDRIFANLFRNAAEAGARTITASATAEGRFVAIAIGDDGRGVPEAMRGSLFKPFLSANASGRTGLGLAIVSDLVRAHGGTITLAETGPAGSVFRLTLPAFVAATGAPGRASFNAAPAPTAS